MIYAFWHRWFKSGSCLSKFQFGSVRRQRFVAQGRVQEMVVAIEGPFHDLLLL